jgi:hypothetical protein
VDVPAAMTDGAPQPRATGRLLVDIEVDDMQVSQAQVLPAGAKLDPPPGSTPFGEVAGPPGAGHAQD